MMRHFRVASAGVMWVAAMAMGASFVAGAAELPHRLLHRISLSGAVPVAALAFGPDGKQLYAAVGDELRSYDAVSGDAGPVVKLPGTGVALVAAARDRGVLYVATRAPARLVVLALQPLRITSSVVLRGGEPSALLFDAEGNVLYVESRTGDSVARLDPESGKTLGVAHLHGRLEQMAVNGRGVLYVANAADNQLEAIETAKMTRTGAIPLSGCSAPTGLATDIVGRRLFVACANGEALVVDEDMGFTFEQLPIQQATGLQTVFALHPFGPDGWKGGAFMAGDGPALDAIQMEAFISYVGGGSLPLDGRCTALSVSPAARQLALALAPRGAAPGIELLTLGGANEEMSQ
jgi:hypothetical protein